MSDGFVMHLCTEQGSAPSGAPQHMRRALCRRLVPSHAALVQPGDPDWVRDTCRDCVRAAFEEAPLAARVEERIYRPGSGGRGARWRRVIRYWRWTVGRLDPWGGWDEVASGQALDPHHASVVARAALYALETNRSATPSLASALADLAGNEPETTAP